MLPRTRLLRRGSIMLTRPAIPKIPLRASRPDPSHTAMAAQIHRVLTTVPKTSTGHQCHKPMVLRSIQPRPLVTGSTRTRRFHIVSHTRKDLRHQDLALE